MDNNLVNEWNEEMIEEQKMRKDEWAIKILGIEVCNVYLFLLMSSYYHLLKLMHKSKSLVTRYLEYKYLSEKLLTWANRFILDKLM